MLDYKEGWMLKNWSFWTVVLKKTFDSPLDCKEIQPVSWKSVLNIHWKDWCWSWSPDTSVTSCEEPTHWKTPRCWEDWRSEEKGTMEGELAGWRHRLSGRELEQAAEDGEGQGSLACCSPRRGRVWHDWGTEQQLALAPKAIQLFSAKTDTFTGLQSLSLTALLRFLKCYDQRRHNLICKYFGILFIWPWKYESDLIQLSIPYNLYSLDLNPSPFCLDLVLKKTENIFLLYS